MLRRAAGHTAVSRSERAALALPAVRVYNDWYRSYRPEQSGSSLWHKDGATMAMHEAPAARSMFVEFGPLDEQQRALIDLHPLRAVGGLIPIETDGDVMEFWLDGADDPDATFDDLRGWAISMRLPIRRLLE